MFYGTGVMAKTRKKRDRNMAEETNKTFNKKQVQEILLARIEQLCKEKRMTYYNLSYKSTIPLSTLIHIMDRTTKNPGIFTIMKICDGFGMTMKEFFDTEEFEEAIVESRDER